MRYFTRDEAEQLLPEARRRIAGVAAAVAELNVLSAAVERGAGTQGGLAEAKALDALIHDELAWFAREGIEVKGVAPALLDFPALVDERVIMLCWLEGEPAISFYHPPETGFAGRAPLRELGGV